MHQGTVLCHFIQQVDEGKNLTENRPLVQSDREPSPGAVPWCRLEKNKNILNKKKDFKSILSNIKNNIRKCDRGFFVLT
jgi:hypothetical protein